MNNALIIGAGISGLASAIRLSSLGMKVTVIEKEENVGGKMGQLEFDGFRFDTGPSLFTWPELLEELFTSTGADLKDYVPYRKLPLITRYFFPNGKSVDALSNPQAFASELRRKTGEDEVKINNYLQEAAELFRKTKAVFLEDAISTRKIFSSQYMAAYPTIPRLQAGISLNEYNYRKLTTPEAVQLFNRYSTYNGSNPYSAPATLRVISHLEHNSGAFFPEQGMYSIARGMSRLAMEKGVEFRFGEEVRDVKRDKGQVKSILTDRSEYHTDILISSIDIGQWQKLTTDKNPNSRYDKNLSSSALIFFWGMKKQYESLKLHNIFFSNDYQEEFRQLFTERSLAKDLTIYIFISSKAVAADAPEGMENWFVMVNAPPDFGQDWQELRSKARKAILERLSSALDRNIEKDILSERIHDPRDIAERTGSYRGALYGPSSNTMFSAFRRQPNQGREKNLFHTGGSVHPGGGIPLCLLSSKIVANKISKSWKNT